MKNILKDVVGATDVLSIVVDVAIVMALFPTIKGFIDTASANMTAGEVAISAIVPLFLVVALLYNVGKQTGIVKD